MAQIKAPWGAERSPHIHARLRSIKIATADRWGGRERARGVHLIDRRCHGGLRRPRLVLPPRVPVTEETRDELRALKSGAERYEDVLQRLIKAESAGN